MAVSEIPTVPPGRAPEAVPGSAVVEPRKEKDARERRRRRKRRSTATGETVQETPAERGPVGRLVDVRV